MKLFSALLTVSVRHLLEGPGRGRRQHPSRRLRGEGARVAGGAVQVEEVAGLARVDAQQEADGGALEVVGHAGGGGGDEEGPEVGAVRGVGREVGQGVGVAVEGWNCCKRR